MGDPKSKQWRVDHGMCPMCGKEAAPYYFCWDCRVDKSFNRLLTKMADRRILKKEGKGKHALFSIGDSNLTTDQFHWGQWIWDLDPDDKRRRPRIGRRPIDLDETLIRIFESAGRPLTMEEILFAWGKLRSQRKTTSLAGDMTAIVLAQRKRDERAAKRAAVLARQPVGTTP